MDNLLQHFRKEEQPFIESVVGWIREVEAMYTPKLTDFLDPRQRQIVFSIVANSGLEVEAYGGFTNAERQRMLLFPSYFAPETTDYQVKIFQLLYPTKFMTLSHRDMLGALMSLGIDRSKFGDIRMVNETIQFAVAQELSTYLPLQMTSVGKAKVKLEEVLDQEQWLEPTERWSESIEIVSSLRLDTIIASLLHLSRQKAVALIQAGAVKVNWGVIDQPTFEVEMADHLSIRGFGRFQIVAVEGRTKKEKIRLVIGKLQ